MLSTSLVVLLLCSSPLPSLSIGINLGNVLEAPTEGAWAPVAQEYYFDEYKAKNFTHVRIPVRWDKHMGTAAPYTIDATFLARVHEIVSWGLARNLTLIINSHHDDWMDNKDNFSSMLPRFLALWTQVAGAKQVPGPAKTYVLRQPGARRFIRNRALRHRDADREYKNIAAAYLFGHQTCEACNERPADHIHHKRGKVGSLKSNSRFFMALCPKCHRWIHDNIAAARLNGWIADAGDWIRTKDIA